MYLKTQKDLHLTNLAQLNDDLVWEEGLRITDREIFTLPSEISDPFSRKMAAVDDLSSSSLSSRYSFVSAQSLA